jgi:divalent metal cation (Fe/Co/Zn/Cd) transporter
MPTRVASNSVSLDNRAKDLRLALLLTYITIGWMTIEAVVAIGAGVVARSLLLVAFGVDSGIELASAVVVFRRFRIELHEDSAGDLAGARAIERRSARIAGYLLFLLSAYVLVQAGIGLVTRHAAESSPAGVAVAVVAAFGMPLLARAKVHVADNLESRALRADATETLTCGYLAWVLLVGLAFNSLTHWWWIDSVASLAIVPFLIREGFEAVAGQHCC